MSYIYEQSQVDNVLQKTDIVNVIQSYQTLNKGDKSYIGVCSFDNENINSMFVNQQQQVFHCVCCGASGNAIDFVMQKEQISFDDALKKLSERANLPMPEKIQVDKNERLLACNDEAAKFYRDCLRQPVGKVASDYFRNERSLKPATVDTFLLGYAPKGNKLHQHLLSKGFTDQEMLDAGLIRENQKNGYSDNFYHRAMFPILDKDKNILGFGGRALDDSPAKYINTRDTEIFHKKDNLYGYNRAKNEGIIIFCEGYVDVIAMQQAGYRGAVASLGTALTDNQIDLINAKEVYLAYDSDSAGQQATYRALMMLREHDKTGKIISLEPYKDPDEFIKNLGRAEFNNRVTTAKDGIVFRQQYIENKYQSPDSRNDSEFVNDVVALVNDIQMADERAKLVQSFTQDVATPIKSQIEAQVRGITITIQSDDLSL